MQDPTCSCIALYVHSQTHTEETAKTEGIFDLYDFLLHLNIENILSKTNKPPPKAQRRFRQLTSRMADASEEVLSIVGRWLFCLVAKQRKRPARALTNCALLPALTLLTRKVLVHTCPFAMLGMWICNSRRLFRFQYGRPSWRVQNRANPNENKMNDHLQ